MRPMVEDGRLFVAMPPLFSVTTTGKVKEKFFALNQVELDKITKRLDSQKRAYGRIIRHKGLGEYSPDVLASQVMDPDTRVLKQITVEDAETVSNVLELTMGNNAANRRDWIIDSRALVSDEDLDI
jgi:DNA gyrase/topoisomerase IV subunit B